MIINWNGDGLEVIPCLGGEGQTVSKVILQPGNNEVKEENWKTARVHVLDKLKSGIIKEDIAAEIKIKIVEKKIEVEDPKTKEKTEQVVKEEKVDITVKSFKKLPIDKSIEIVLDTYNLDTLHGWEKSEGRDSVRAEIKNQIEKIENYQGNRKKDLIKREE